MSDDIRVYWDERMDDYCMIMIDTGDFYWGYNMYDSPYTGSGFDVQLWLPFDLGESIPASYSLVYDSTEDTAWIKMIDDNLVVPDVHNGEKITAGYWGPHDYAYYAAASAIAFLYHQGKEWTA